MLIKINAIRTLEAIIRRWKISKKMQIAIKYIVNFILQRIIIILIGLFYSSLFNFIVELDQIGKNANFLNSTFKIMVLKIPNVTYEIIPIATLIGGHGHIRVVSNSEFTAFRVGGLTPQKHF